VRSASSSDPQAPPRRPHLRSPDPTRIESLLSDYTTRFYTDFYARLDAPAKPTA
jgi:hypothetical protein